MNFFNFFTFFYFMDLYGIEINALILKYYTMFALRRLVGFFLFY